MRKSKLSRALIVFLALLTAISPVGINAAEGTSTTTSIEEVRELLEAQTYYDYLQENNNLGIKDGEGSVTIKAAENFEFAKDEEYGKEGDIAKKVTDPDGEKGDVLYVPATGTVSWKISIPTTGYYTVKLTYRPVEDDSGSANTSTIERVLRIDGKVPFKEANYFEMTRSFKDVYTEQDDKGNPTFKLDFNGNDKKPEKKQSYSWNEYSLCDSAGFHVDPFKFVFEAGERTIALEATMNDMYLYDITVAKAESRISYEKYIEQYASLPAVDASASYKIQAEYPVFTSDLTIYALNDRTSPITEPQDPAKQKLNTIGGSKWQNIGQWIEWTIPADAVTQSGLYNIIPRYLQNTLAGLYVSRRIMINGEIPFEEASYLQFNYADDWATAPLNNGEQEFKFYLEANKEYTIRLEVVYGNLSDALRRCETSLTNMNEIYNSILRITGPSPDENMDYGFAEQIYDTIILMKQTRDELQAIVNMFLEISEGKSAENIATLEKIIFILNKMCTDEDEIAKNLENLKVNSGTLGTWIMNTKLQPLTLDYLLIQPAEAEIPEANATFWQSLWFEVSSFFQSFFTDYNSLGASEQIDEENVVEVWIATSRDEAQVMRELVDKDCPVTVNLKLVAGGTLLPATLAGTGPDISLATGQADVINYAIRSAIEPLSQFDDYFDYVGNTSRFNPETLVGLRLQNPEITDENDPHYYDYYGVPERLGFVMMFYRKDIFAELDIEVPRTWDDLYEIVPDLQTNYRDVGMASSLGGLQIFMYQLDEDLYKENGMRINIDSNTSLDCFKKLCDLFTSYNFPRVFDLATYFRMGEMPIAVADYLTYNHFSIYATEIKGLWEFVPLPGTIDPETGELNNSVPCSVSAVILMADENRSEKVRNDAWEFIKWWTDAPAQSEYARQYEALIGMAAKYNTANMEALRSMPWTSSEMKNLEAQFQNLKGTPEYPGGYIITRYVDFAFLDAYNNGTDPVDALLDNVVNINSELSRKRQEFGLPIYEEVYGNE